MTSAITEQHHQPAARAAHQRQVLRVHAAVYAGSIVLIVLVNLALNAVAGLLGEWWAWWSVLAVLGWGLGLFPGRPDHGILTAADARVHTRFHAAECGLTLG